MTQIHCHFSSKSSKIFRKPHPVYPSSQSYLFPYDPDSIIVHLTYSSEMQNRVLVRGADKKLINRHEIKYVKQI